MTRIVGRYRRSTAFDAEGICHYVMITEVEEGVEEGVILWRTDSDCGALVHEENQSEREVTSLQCLAGKEEDIYTSLWRDFEAIGLIK